MRFTVITYGTEGDTRPLACLCRALLDRGHEVRLFADRSTLSTAEDLGVATQALAGDMRSVTMAESLARVMRHGGDVFFMAKAVAGIAREHAAEWMRAAALDAHSSDAVLFSGIASYAGLSVAEYLGLPAIGLGLWPMSATTEFASSLLPPWRLPGWANFLSHRAVNAMLWRAMRSGVNVARQEALDLPPRQTMWDGYPILYGVSRHLVPQPADWPAHWRICGPWFALNDDMWKPPVALADFLAAGEPPVYVGFGSMAGFNAPRLLDTVVRAMAGRRALLFSGWSGVDAATLPPNFFPVGPTPHHWLFPRTSMVVHHGGAGTTHTAAYAGVPSVVIPFAGDQFFWAERLARAGVAPRWVQRQRLDASALGSMLTWASQPQVMGRAKELSQAMAQEQQEGGVVCTAAMVERLVACH